MRPVRGGHLVLIGQEPLVEALMMLVVVPTLNAITARTFT
jgi:hypothetical protein